nr:gustatory receptor 7 [Pachyrhinus yasumatsui]
MKRITQLEQKVHFNSEGSMVKDCNWKKLKMKICLYHMVYIATHVYDSIVNWKDASYSLAFVIFRFTTYYIMFSTLLVTFFCTWLKNRYLFLDHFLKDSVVSKQFRFVVLEKESTGVYYDKLKEFSKNYKSLYFIVQEFNEVFGYQIFLICIGTVLEILNAFNYGMPTAKNGFMDATFVNTLYSTLYVVCTTRIVMACDSVEISGRNIQKTCLILYENCEKCETKEEFYRLENYVQGLCPEFSAAGFWHINQRVLSTLFSSVMTYLIIIIQFNITLQ